MEQCIIEDEFCLSIYTDRRKPTLRSLIIIFQLIAPIYSCRCRHPPRHYLSEELRSNKLLSMINIRFTLEVRELWRSDWPMAHGSELVWMKLTNWHGKFTLECHFDDCVEVMPELVTSGSLSWMARIVMCAANDNNRKRDNVRRMAASRWIDGCR